MFEPAIAPHRPTHCHALPADQRGSITVLAAMIFPLLIGLGAWSLNSSYMHREALLLRQTVQAASLAAANMLTSYYTSGTNSTTSVVAMGQTLAQANMPVAKHGTVVPAGNVVLGNWDANTSTFTSLATSGGASPNAVQVIGLATAANGNPAALLFSGVTGIASRDYTSTAIAGYGSSQTFHTIIINDLSTSFSGQIANQRAADTAILDCVRTNSGTESEFGITAITGHATTYVGLTPASTGLATIQAKITALRACGNAGMPACSGSNVAAGLYSAKQQFSGAAYNNTKKNIVIITDGIPNANAITYTAADGIYPTPASVTPTCTSNCTDANLLTMAQNQATNARNAGISVSTIYYSGNTSSGSRAFYAASLAALIGGTGVAMVAPTPAQISTTFAGFCATMSSSVKAVM